MHIEFHNPQAQVKKWVLDYVTEKLFGLYQRDKKIVSAGVYYREPVDGGGDNKVCEIILAYNGHTLLVHHRSASFEQASKDAIKELTGRLAVEQKTAGIPLVKSKAV